MATVVQTLARRIVDIEIWVVAPLVAFSVALPRSLPIVVGIISLFWCMRWIAFGYPSVHTPTDLAMAALVCLVPVTIWVTSQPDTTYTQVYRLLSAIFLYYAVVNWTSSAARARLIMLGLIAAGLVLVGVGLVSVRWQATAPLPQSVTDGLPILITDTINPNVMGGTLVVLLPLAVALALFAWSRISWPVRLLTLVVLLSIPTMLVLTQSRGAMVAGGLAIACIIVLRWNRLWSLIPLGLIGIGALVRIFGVQILLDRLAFSGTVQSLSGRLEIWSRALYMAQDFMFTGVGLGTFGTVADLLYPFSRVSPATIPHTHNMFLQLAVDLGIFGLIAWLTIVILSITTAWNVYYNGWTEEAPYQTAIGAGILGSQIAMLTHGLFDAVTWINTRPGVLMWAIWGLSIAVWRMEVFDD